jgi:TatD DNase family protein
MQLFDTHTHFDVADFDLDRQHLAEQAKRVGVDALVLIGFVESRFDDLIQTHQQLQYWENVPSSYLAPGLHPFYIEQHQPELYSLESYLKNLPHNCKELSKKELLEEIKKTQFTNKEAHEILINELNLRTKK